MIATAQPAHLHAWTRDTSRNRFTCACGVVGHAPQMIPGQHRAAGTKVVPYSCYARVNGRNCGAEATHVTGDRQQSRCAKHAPAPFCALCTSTTGPFARRPLGKDDAMVAVCSSCDTEKPIEGHGRELGYVANEDAMTWLEFNKRVDGFRSAKGIPKAEPYTSVTKRLTPGWILVRVPGLDEKGQRRDMYEASLTFAHEPWAVDAAWVGATASWCLFERPDPDAKDKAPSRNKSQHDVIAFR